jgi:hypothetical protein
MPRWNIKTKIAGVDFSNCRATIIDGDAFASDFRGSITPAADGTPHVERANKGVKGNKFGVSMLYAEAQMIKDTLAAIQAAEADGEPFVVELEDALYDLALYVYLDYDQRPYTHGPESEDIIQNVVFRFVALSVVEAEEEL